MVRTITFSVYLALPNLLGVKAGKPPPQHKGRGGSASFDTHPAASCFATMCVMETDQSGPSEPVATVKHTEALFRVSARVIRGLKLDVWLGGGGICVSTNTSREQTPNIYSGLLT